MKKVIIVTNIPNQYRIPLFNEANKQFADAGIKLKVLFGSLGYSRRQNQVDMNDCKFEYDVLHSPKFDLGDNEKTYFTYKGLVKAIKREQPDAIIVGGYSAVTIRLWLRSFFHRTKYIIWSGAIHKKGQNDSWLRIIIRKFLIQRASGFIAYGSKAKEYFESLGAPSQKIFIAINTVDTEFFSNRTKSLKSSLKKTDEKKHLTYVGYLTPRKNVNRLMEVVNELSKSRNDFVLDVLGDGEDRIKLEMYVKENKLSEYVKFHGFIQKENVPEFFSISNCFLFQTDFDIWGLVLNEAMAAGLPCISSTNAGATFDLIEEGVTGFKVDFSDTEYVKKKISLILDNDEKAKQIGENASRYIHQHATIAVSAAGMVRAATIIL